MAGARRHRAPKAPPATPTLLLRLDAALATEAELDQSCGFSADRGVWALSSRFFRVAAFGLYLLGAVTGPRLLGWETSAGVQQALEVSGSSDELPHLVDGRRVAAADELPPGALPFNVMLHDTKCSVGAVSANICNGTRVDCVMQGGAWCRSKDGCIGFSWKRPSAQSVVSCLQTNLTKYKSWMTYINKEALNESSILAPEPQYVQKSQFGNLPDSVRVVFVAGLEGSGHHAWEAVFRACWKASSICHVPQAIQKLLYQNNTWGLFNAWFSTEWQWYNQREALVQHLQHEKVKREKMGGGILILNTASYVQQVGEMSYPNFAQGPERALRRPDLHLLAWACEQAGIDLRIVVLNRDAEQIFHSTVTHRRFARPIRQTDVLVDNGFALYGQLSTIDKRFVKCIGIYDPASPPFNRLTELGAFLHPRFMNSEKTLWDKVFHLIHTDAFKKEPEPDEVATALINRISVPTELIAAYCQDVAAASSR